MRVAAAHPPCTLHETLLSSLLEECLLVHLKFAPSMLRVIPLA